MATLRFIASAPVGSGVVFDYMLSPSLLTPAQRPRFDALAQRVASAGEPWQAFFDPAVADKRSASHGLRICRGQRAGRDQYKVLQRSQRRASSREFVALDESSGLRCQASRRNPLQPIAQTAGAG